MAKVKVKQKVPRSRPQTRMKPLAMSKARMNIHLKYNALGVEAKKG